MTGTAHERSNDATTRARLPTTVVWLGLVSLFTDLSSDAMFPLLPAFLVSLGATGAFIGLVEGAAEFVANLLKFTMGRWVDSAARLKPFVILGYGISMLARPMAAFAVAPWHILAVRTADRVGKGIRTTPRDALIAAAVDHDHRAQAYGFHRALDHAGAVLGTLFATAALWLLGASGAAGPENVAKMRVVFLWAGLPGLAAMVCLVLTPEPVRPSIANQAGLGDRRLSPTLKRVLVALTLFALANATDAFLIVKATKLGAAPALAPMLWLVLHTVKAATATRGGRLADRYGRRNALVCGWLVYAALWASIGAVTSLPALFALTALYGTSHGLVEGAERAFIAELSSGRNRGAAFGVYNLLIGMASLSASGLFGLAWDRFGSGVAFAGSGAFAVLAATSLLVLVPSHGVTQSP